MARKSVHCSCGTDFPMPEIPPTILHCPKCGEAVRFASVDSDGAVQVREDIRERPIKPLPVRNPYYPLVLLVALGLLIAGGLVGLIVLFSDREVPPNPIASEGVRAKPRPKEPILSIHEIPNPPPDDKPTSAPPRPAVPTEVPPAAFDAPAALARAHKLLARVNLARIVTTLMYLTNRIEDYRALSTVLEREEEELRQVSASLVDRPEGATLGDYYRSGDMLLTFGTRTLYPHRAEVFVESLRDWIATAQAGVTVMATVQRNGKTLILPMWFPEIPVDIVPREMRADRTLSAAVLPLPKDTLLDVQRRTAALHPYHRNALSPDDALRLERLLKEGRGTSDDLEFLSGRITAFCARCESEMASFQAKVSSLESAAAASQAIDTVTFKDGRRVQGQIEEDTDQFVRIKGRFGAMTAPKTEVLRIERGDTLGGEFRRRYDAARGKILDLTPLLPWCKDRSLTVQRELVAYAILTLDPGSDAAWNALGIADRSVKASGPEFDTIWLKDGTKREGIITDENETALQLDVIVRGAKTETIGTGKAVIQKYEILRVDRMSEAARKRATDRALSFVDRAQKTQEFLSRVVVTPDAFMGFRGLRAGGTLFELHSTCPEPLVRETAHTLEEMFNAYRKHFSIRRNAAKKVDVYFLANAAEFDKFQQTTRGSVSSNPAYFDTQANHIAAFYGVQKEEEARLRAIILDSEREIEQSKKQISADEDRVTRDFRARRQVVLDEATKAKKGIEDGKILASIDRQKQEKLNEIKAEERAALDILTKNRSKANQAIAEHELIIRHNQSVLQSQVRSMYEILFHECFHAFATNYLWEEADNAGLPRWLHEGMATYFERSVVEAGELVHGGVHPEFLALLRKLQRENRLVAVGTIVTAGAEMFQTQHSGDIPRQEAAYAHAWGLAHYLISKGVTRERIEAYVTDVAPGKDKVAAFEKLAGKRLGDIEAEWRVHLNSLR